MKFAVTHSSYSVISAGMSLLTLGPPFSHAFRILTSRWEKYLLNSLRPRNETGLKGSARNATKVPKSAPVCMQIVKRYCYSSVSWSPLRFNTIVSETQGKRTPTLIRIHYYSYFVLIALKREMLSFECDSEGLASDP